MSSEVEISGFGLSVHKIKEDAPPEERSAKQLAEPSGYHILLALPEVKSTFDSGIVKADATIDAERVTSVVGFVAKMGPDCYKDPERYPSGPWCKLGDFVLIGAFKGTRIKVHGQEMRMINDDDVLGTVEDPRGYSRA